MPVGTYEIPTRPSLHDKWLEEASLLDIDEAALETTEVFLAEMESHHPYTYEHSMRIGLLAARIGSLIPELDDLPPGALFIAGTRHDEGKLNIRVEILDKDGGLTEEEWEKVRNHPRDSHDALKADGLLLEAGAAVLHHAFQPKNPYPKPEEIPEPDPQLPDHLARLQPAMGKVIALADCYDACHREEGATSEEIKTKIYAAYPEYADLLDQAYDQGILT